MVEMGVEAADRKTLVLGKEIVGRINQLAAISETPEHLARIFLTPEHRRAADLILTWMHKAGMSAHLDGISHHPDQHVELADADAGARVLLKMIENFKAGGVGLLSHPHGAKGQRK